MELQYAAGRIAAPLLSYYEPYQLDYLTYPSLEETGIVKHLFSTRTGGVSTGFRSSMNLNVSNGDTPEAVLENYRRIGEVLGALPKDMVLSHQTHTDHIRVVTEQDAGKGLVVPRDYEDVDGLLTNCRGLVLATSYADCVPIFFVDPVKKAIGLAHSGWKGTVLQIGPKMVQQMSSAYGSNPADLVVAIGPSICQDCYEVGEDVASAFEALRELPGWRQQEEALYKEGYVGGYEAFAENRCSMVASGKVRGKFQLDLWAAVAISLRLVGVKRENLTIPSLCTCHNPQQLFSHRASSGKRGNLNAFLLLK